MLAGNPWKIRDRSKFPLYLCICQVWRQHQDRIVGSVWAYTNLDENGTLWYRARKIDWPCPKRPVNFVLTIGMLLHKKYLDAYW